MVAKKSDAKQLEKEMKNALKDIKKLITNVGRTVKKDFGKIRVKYREGKVVKKARSDLGKGLLDLAKFFRKSAKKVKGSK